MKVKHLGFFGCSQCNRSFKIKRDLVLHQEAHALNHVCEQCGKEYNKAAALTYHIQSKHNKIDSNSPEIRCQICMRDFKHTLNPQSVLRKHVERVHNSETCYICGKTVKRLSDHLDSVHTSDDKKKEKCDQCPKGFKDKNQLKVHLINVHLKTRPYRCRYDCIGNIGYNDLSNRNSHEKKKHGQLFLQRTYNT